MFISPQQKIFFFTRNSFRMFGVYFYTFLPRFFDNTIFSYHTIQLFPYLQCFIASLWNLFGGGKENRTPDPLLARQMLSQLSYTPIVGSMLWRSWSFRMLSFFDGFLFFFVFSLSVWCDLWVRENVVGLTRLELVTSRLSGVRSNQLSYRPIHLRVWFSQNWAVLRIFKRCSTNISLKFLSGMSP